MITSLPFEKGEMGKKKKKKFLNVVMCIEKENVEKTNKIKANFNSNYIFCLQNPSFLFYQFIKLDLAGTDQDVRVKLHLQ